MKKRLEFYFCVATAIAYYVMHAVGRFQKIRAITFNSNFISF